MVLYLFIWFYIYLYGFIFYLYIFIFIYKILYLFVWIYIYLIQKWLGLNSQYAGDIRASPWWFGNSLMVLATLWSIDVPDWFGVTVWCWNSVFRRYNFTVRRWNSVFRYSNFTVMSGLEKGGSLNRGISNEGKCG